MHYVLLIYQAEELWEQWTDDERREVLAGHFAMRDNANANGHYVDGQKLMPCSSATTLAAQGGRLEIRDGPFAETKEQLAGFYLLDCDNLDQAIGYAKQIPNVGTGAIEIRPVDDYSGLVGD